MTSKKTDTKTKKNSIWLSTLCASVLFTLFSLFILPGYDREEGDQGYYIAPIFQKAVPQAYSRDFMMEGTQTNVSLFDELVGVLLFGDPNNMFVTIFWIAAFSKILFFLGIILFSYALSKNWIMSLCMPFFFLVGHEGFVCNAHPAEQWMFSFETELHARSLAISISMLAIALYFLGKKWMSWIVASISILIHVISALPVIFFMSMHTIWCLFLRKKSSSGSQKWTDFFFLLIPLFSIGLLFLTMPEKGAGGMEFFRIYDAQWVGFAKDRAWWIFSWDHFSSLGVLLTIYLPLILFFAIALKNNIFSNETRQDLVVFGISMITLITIGLIGFDLFGISLFGQLQLHRASIWLRILLVIAVLIACLKMLATEKTSHLQKALFFFALISIPLGGEYILLPFSILLFFILLYAITPRKKKTASPLFWSTAVFIAILVFFFSSRTELQLDQIKAFVVSISSDPEIAIGYFLLWFQKIILICGGILGIFVLQQKKPKYLEKTLCASTIAILIMSGAIFLERYSSFVSFPDGGQNAALFSWVKDNTTYSDLFLGTPSAEELTNDIRDYLGRSVMITYAEGGQGAFNRDYAMEWLHRREIQSDPERYWEEITQEYKVDYLISDSEEEFPKAGLVYSDGKYRIYSLQEEK